MSRASPQGSTSLPKERRFSEATALQLCSTVEVMESRAAVEESKLAAALRDLAEVLVYNDRHNEAVVDKVLMERALMSTLERLVTNAMLPTSVQIHVLQCVTMLLQNFTRLSSVYFVCSNNHINRMIAIPLDEDDDELVSMFVSFLKSLALRLNKDTVQFFFEIETSAFPLFDKAVKMLNTTTDAMVRAATRQIVVCVAQVDDGAIQKFLLTALQEVYEGVLLSIAKQLAETAKLVPSCEPVEDRELSTITFNPRSLVVRMEDIIDEVLYLNDLSRSAPAATDAAALRRAAETVIIHPLASILSATAAKGHSCQRSDPQAQRSHGSSSTLADVPPSAALGFLARWACTNEITAVQDALRCGFLDIPQDATESSPCLLLRLMLRCPQLTPAALLMREALLPAKDNGDATTTSESVMNEPPWESVESFLDALDTSGGLANASDKYVGRTALECLLRTLEGQLASCARGGALCSLVLLVRQIQSCLTLSGRRRFSTFAGELCLHPLRHRIREVYQPILTSGQQVSAADAAQSAPRHMREACAAADAEELDSWLQMHFYVKGLGLRDPYAVSFLQARAAWEVFTTVGAQDGVFRCYSEKDVSPMLPLMTSIRSRPEHAAPSSPEGKTKYASLQEQIREHVPLWHRAPATLMERAQAPYLAWFTVAQCCHSATQGDDDALTTAHAIPFARQFALMRTRYSGVCPSSSPLTVGRQRVSSLGGQRVLRCQMVFMHARHLSDDRKEGGTSLPVGTCLHLAITEAEVLFLEAPDHDNVAAAIRQELATGTDERNVLLACDLAYTRAAILPAPASYRAVVQGLCPGKEVELHLTFTDAESAVRAVRQLNGKSHNARKLAAALSREVIGALSP